MLLGNIRQTQRKLLSILAARRRNCNDSVGHREFPKPPYQSGYNMPCSVGKTKEFKEGGYYGVDMRISLWQQSMNA